MAQGNPEKDRLFGRLNSIDSELSEASRSISTAENEANAASGGVGGLAPRLAAVRGSGYAALGHLDKTIELLTQRSAQIVPAVQAAAARDLGPLGAQIRGLQAETNTLRQEIDRGNFMAAEGLANRLTGDAGALRSRASSTANQVLAPLRELTNGLAAVDRDLKIAESTVALFGQAHFPMQQAESMVMAVPGKLMEGEKSHGTLFLTNQRFLFQGQHEVVLEKHLGIVTKKRMEEVLVLQQPIGAVQEITKGRVGLLAGTGIFVQFKPEVSVPMQPIDVPHAEADVVTRFYRYVVGGEADRDIQTAHGGAAPPPKIQLARCPSCGAPHTGEIYQGQASVKCEYCGSDMTIH